MDRAARRGLILQQAWIGDSVLTLYARLRILREGGGIDGARAARMTSNEFLAAVAEPSHAEAEIGRLFEREGLEAAFRWIEERLMPAFERQEANRARRQSRKKPAIVENTNG
jgi:hypothetical protein